MTRAMSHRGPDDEGVFVDGPVGLGHRRLAVIDTTRAGRQPMADSGGALHVVFNGEIYNFRDLRRTLSTKGAIFRTGTDTEVVLEAYKVYGLDFVEHLHGMFAFAIWDSSERRLLLVRDRIGKKPLFYRLMAGGGIAFASSLLPLAQLDPALNRIELQSLSSYFALGYVPGPQTLLKGISKLEPGHMLLLNPLRQPTITRYWDLAAKFRTKSTYADVHSAAAVFSDLFNDAVQCRLLADVPLGAFLSGGIDSSAVVGAMNSSFSVRPRVFSIGFRETAFDELPMARTVARHFGALHHTKVLDSSSLGCLGDIVNILDEPLADSSIIPSYLLAQFSREWATVCLTGDGGDELFAGYDTYIATQLCRYTRFLPVGIKQLCLSLLNRFPLHSRGKVPLDFKLRQFLTQHSADPLRSHASWRTVINTSDAQRLLNSDYLEATRTIEPLTPVLLHLEEAREMHWLDAAMYMDMKTWLVDDVLVKVDRTAMAFGLEPRSPLLDHRLVEFSASLPSRFKMNWFLKKRLLKVAFAKKLPRCCLAQKKSGFNAPLAQWMDSKLKIAYQYFLEDQKSFLRDIIDQCSLDSLFQNHIAKRADNSHKLFLLLVLQLWGKRFSATL